MMRQLLIVIAFVFLISWIIGFFIYSIGALIHLLLVIAMGSLLWLVLDTRKKT